MNLMRARLIVGLLMLTFAFIGMVITDVYQGGSWDYWKWVVPIYAILALALSLYAKRHASLLREGAHWFSLIAAIFLISHFSQIGLMSRFLAGIVHLVLVSLTVFLAGLYIEPSFLFIGLCLGLLSFFTAVLSEYIYAIALPVLIGCALIFAIWTYLSHRKNQM
jgi:hypothetical protein